MISDAFSNVAYRVSLRGPGAGLDGSIQTPPPPAQLVLSTGPERVNVLNECNFKTLKYFLQSREKT